MPVVNEEQKPQVRPMYRSVFHDTDNDRMYVWYVDGTFDAVPVKHEFYTTIKGQYNAVECGMKNIWDQDVYKIEIKKREGLSAYEFEKRIRQEHSGPNNNLAEIDIDPRCRFLQDHYKDAGMMSPKMEDINLCFMDIENATTGRFSAPVEALYPINVVTLSFSKGKKRYTFGLQRDIDEKSKEFLRSKNCEYVLCSSEADLISKVMYCIGSNDVDILSGWNFGYDTVYMATRIKKLNEGLPRAQQLSLDLMSRMRGHNKHAYLNKENELVINGTEVIDFLALYKKYTFSEESSYKLDYIGGKVVGQHKAPLPDGYQSWINHWSDYVVYNFIDVELLELINEKTQMFKLAVTSAAAARVPVSFVFESKKMLTGFVLDHLHHTGRVFPPYKTQTKEEFPGAFVYSVPGYKEYLVSYDYRSLYPSIMMTFNTSPEMKVTFPMDYVLTEEERKNLIKSPWDHNGRYQVYFRKDKIGVVPEVTRLLFDGRSNLKKQMKKAKKAGDMESASVFDMMQKVYKVLGNSLYGLLGSNYFALYDVDNAASITAYGQRLIKFTIECLAEYINNDISTDDRFYNVFGYRPEIDPELVGTFEDQKTGEINYKRMSHGDTDSFFVKFGDIYEPFRQKQGTGTSVLVFKGHELVEHEKFDNDHEMDSKKFFNKMCLKYDKDGWTSKEMRTPDEHTGFTKCQITFADGIYFCGDHRVIYNRYRLTDFCRILDACILEEELDKYMLAYANKWNYLTNELFLKREKCIYKAIVTAKKKYICLVESMEDIVYLDKGHKENGKWIQGDLSVKPEYAITGLELVRSSTAMFGRDRMMEMVDLMMDGLDRTKVRNRLLEMKKEFFKAVAEDNINYIACPSGVKTAPPPFEVLEKMTTEEKLANKYEWRCQGASVWNYLILHDPELSKHTYEPVAAGSKIRFIKKADKLFGVSIICYTGEECPPRLLEIFHPDWEEHWKTSVAQILGRLFEAVGWDEQLEYDESDFMLEYF